MRTYTTCNTANQAWLCSFRLGMLLKVRQKDWQIMVPILMLATT